MIAILKREWKSYFQNITGWLWDAAFAGVFNGCIFWGTLL